MALDKARNPFLRDNRKVAFVDRAYKISNTWLGLHEDITKLMVILKKNLFPAYLIERVVNRYVTGTLSIVIIVPGIPFPLQLYFTLLYLLVSTRAVIGQFSGPYSPVRPAKI